MLKSIILFFRKRNIRKNHSQERPLIFPDFDKSPTVTIMLDYNGKKDIKEIEQFVKLSMKPKTLGFVVLCETIPDDIIQSDLMFFVQKEDFNKFGILQKDKESALKTISNDVLVNLSDDNDNLLNDYLVSCINSSFRIGHSKINMKIHDLVLDYGIEKSDVERLKILYKYLMMLSGKNEK